MTAIPMSRARRLPGLDWLRAIAAVLVIVLHAGMPYLTHPFPGLIWATTASETSPTVNAVCWSINGFIMPLFFLMTGYLAARLLEQRGSAEFVKHRLLRIGGPLLFGLVFILPFDLYAWLLGWVDADLIPFGKLSSLKVRGELGASLWGVSHLWYLEYVLVFCLLGCGLQWRRVDKSILVFKTAARFENAGFQYGVVALGALVAGAALAWDSHVVIGFRCAWLPQLPHLLYYSAPFAIGWLWSRVQRGPSRAELTLGALAAAGLWIGLWPSLLNHLQNDATGGLPYVPWLYALFAVTMSTSLFGLAISVSEVPVPATINYLSRASFWIYLIHHPLVGLSHVSLARIPWSGLAETLLVTIGVLALCLASYEVLVRRTWVGWLLNGFREQPLGTPVAVDPAESRRQAA